jgi:transcription antitermination factor NusG
VNIADSNISKSDLPWYAVVTRSRQEKAAASMLTRVDIPTFLPLITEMHTWSDRKQAVTVPLFSCYLFVQIPAGSELPLRVLRTPGVVRFVGNQQGPLPIPSKEIEDVRAIVSKDLDYSPYPFLTIGKRVRIVDGALKGLEGTLIARGPESKLVVSIELIQRSLAISIYDFAVEPVEARRGLAA